MIIIILIILGLCLGSFVNALVWRIHKQAAGTKSAKYSITKGHSMCESCGHRLYARDLIPILSWIELGGRCRYCKTSIGWQNPLAELATVFLFIISYVAWPYGWSPVFLVAFGLWLASLVIMVALVVFDLRWMLLPDRLVYPLISLAIAISICLAIGHDSAGIIVRAGLNAILLSGLFWLLFQISNGRWIGGGDVKLAVALGFLNTSLLGSVLLLFISSLLGCLVSLPVLIMGKSVSHKIPFGPFLIIAAITVFLWGQQMIEWYNQLIFL